MILRSIGSVWSSQVALVAKNSPINAGDIKDIREVKGTQLCLTLCDLMNYTVHGILQARILEWVEEGFNSWVRKIPWRRAWQPAPVLLTGESHGQRSLAGCSPWDCKEPNTTETA